MILSIDKGGSSYCHKVPAPPTTSLDVILAPTQHAQSTGYFTIQIPRQLLDSKNPDGTDKSFRVTLDGHGLAWKELQNNASNRTLGVYFGGGATASYKYMVPK